MPKPPHQRRWLLAAIVAGATAAAAPGVLAASPTPSQELADITAEALAIAPGSSGPAVVILQDTLNDWGQTSPSSGQFDTATQAAVSALAAQLDASADDLQTQLALMGYGPRSLLLGSGETGAMVSALQRALTRAGFGVGVSGEFGAQTEQEVLAFEKSAGLTQDDQISLWTVEAIAAVDGAQAPAASTPDAAGPAADSAPLSGLRADVVSAAKALNGRAYDWGGTGPWGFDCSGLTMYVLRSAAGIVLPHNSFAQWDSGQAVPAGALQPGDLVFFDTDGPGPSHVGVYVGGSAQDFVDATDYGGGVQVDSLYNSYWGRHYVGARNILLR